MDRSSNTNHDGDKGVSFPTFCSKGLNEWVVFVNFFLGRSVGEFVVILCEFNDLGKG